MITNVKTVAVYVSDQEAALRFYTEMLGFEVRSNQPMGPRGNWLEVAPPGAETRVVVYPLEMMEGWEQRKRSMVFGCEDTEATCQELSNQGVSFTQGATKMAWRHRPQNWLPADGAAVFAGLRRAPQHTGVPVSFDHLGAAEPAGDTPGVTALYGGAVAPVLQRGNHLG